MLCAVSGSLLGSRGWKLVFFMCPQGVASRPATRCVVSANQRLVLLYYASSGAAFQHVHSQRRPKRLQPVRRARLVSIDAKVFLSASLQNSMRLPCEA